QRVHVLGTNIECDIVGIYNFGAGDLLEISYNANTFLIPFTKENFPNSDDKIAIARKAFNVFGS
ncbi:MAG: hypothetical protein LBS23_03730, partial [Holosporaceae bacterium]|nr:hypothetical protein [Holosporaceae bacterium]